MCQFGIICFVVLLITLRCRYSITMQGCGNWGAERSGRFPEKRFCPSQHCGRPSPKATRSLPRSAGPQRSPGPLPAAPRPLPLSLHLRRTAQRGSAVTDHLSWTTTSQSLDNHFSESEPLPGRVRETGFDASATQTLTSAGCQGRRACEDLGDSMRGSQGPVRGHATGDRAQSAGGPLFSTLLLCRSGKSRRTASLTGPTRPGGEGESQPTSSQQLLQSSPLHRARLRH